MNGIKSSNAPGMVEIGGDGALSMDFTVYLGGNEGLKRMAAFSESREISSLAWEQDFPTETWTPTFCFHSLVEGGRAYRTQTF